MIPRQKRAALRRNRQAGYICGCQLGIWPWLIKIGISIRIRLNTSQVCTISTSYRFRYHLDYLAPQALGFNLKITRLGV